MCTETIFKDTTSSCSSAVELHILLQLSIAQMITDRAGGLQRNSRISLEVVFKYVAVHCSALRRRGVGGQWGARRSPESLGEGKTLSNQTLSGKQNHSTLCYSVLFQARHSLENQTTQHCTDDQTQKNTECWRRIAKIPQNFLEQHFYFFHVWRQWTKIAHQMFAIFIRIQIHRSSAG